MIIEPVQTFDYRHKPVNRIPVPQRPKWLSETVKNIREFEPLTTRHFEPLRRYDDWKYDDRRVYDPYYDDKKYNYPRRQYERDDSPKYQEPRASYLEQRGSYPESRASYPEKRGYDYDSRGRSYDKYTIEDEMDYNDKSDFDSRKKDLFAIQDPEQVSNRRSINKPEIRQDKVIEKPRVPLNTSSNKVTLIEDLLSPPGRFSRPSRIVIILRGPPGSGKSFLAKLIKDKEVRIVFVFLL